MEKDHREISRKAIEMAEKQRAISIAEFFEKNRHLLGFDNPRKALLTVVKEAVDNSLDACEEAGILPEINVEIYDLGNNRYRIAVEDNGPGIVKEQIPHIFARLLYGSKFHKLSQSRGQQGIGISAAVLYGQLTTGKAAKIKSKIPNKKAFYCELLIDTKTNTPKIIEEREDEWDKEHGTRIEIEIEGSYARGVQSVDEYIKETAIVNPHLTIVYLNPKGEQFILHRATKELPAIPKEIKPHPYGVELGKLKRMLSVTKYKNLVSFFKNEFSRVSRLTAIKICKLARVPQSRNIKELTHEEIERLHKAMQKVKVRAPPTNCLSPLDREMLINGLKKEFPGEFYSAVIRKPSVYRGNPFQVQAALVYGENLNLNQALLLRFANHTPLLYNQAECVITKAAQEINWRSYGLSQSEGSLPNAPVVILVDFLSVWIPYTSEGKQAIANYPEILKEIKLALQEIGRDLGSFLRKKAKIRERILRKQLFERYIPEVAKSLEILTDVKAEIIKNKLEEMIKRKADVKIEEVEK